jgi:hypothetical protein
MSFRPRQWKFRIRHILDAIAENSSYTYGDFCADSKTMKTIVWNLVIIGEAARLIPPDIEKAYREIPWTQIRGMEKSHRSWVRSSGCRDRLECNPDRIAPSRSDLRANLAGSR